MRTKVLTAISSGLMIGALVASWATSAFAQHSGESIGGGIGLAASEREDGFISDLRLDFDCRVGHFDPAGGGSVEYLNGSLPLIECPGNNFRLRLTTGCGDDPVTVRVLPDGRRVALMFGGNYRSVNEIRATITVWVVVDGQLPDSVAALTSSVRVDDTYQTSLLWSLASLCEFRIARE